ncbi:MAG: chemotaxis protein CheR [Bacteroidetes bacterium 4572_128]|nr:MAG: chemotaxis protein CheR [Bacteroidetes bacterium 4572_128]
MNISILDKIYNAKFTERDFQRLSDFIQKNYGIKMPPEKKIMLKSRLQKRLKKLNIISYKEYIDFVFSKNEKKKELVNMMDAVSTNKTDFFREKKHFDFLSKFILPKILEDTSKRYLKLWSSACSSGEEVYTMAIILNEFLLKNPAFSYSILGTDISTIVLNKAIRAIYPNESINNLDIELKRKYFLKSKNANIRKVRIISNLRNKVSFKRLNLMDNFYNNINNNFDIIFCRNVLIYFDRKVQEKVIRKLCKHLVKGGYFFLGHSESIIGMNLPLVQIKPTVLKKI